MVAKIRAANGRAFAVTADVTDRAAVERMFETVAAHGRLRVPGQQCFPPSRQPIHEMTEEDWRRVHSVTLDGAFRCIRSALPALSPGGRVVNILGRNALSGDPGRVHVSAAKFIGLFLATIGTDLFSG